MVFENIRKLPSFLAKKDEESISKCQKCLETGHWTFECKNKRVFLNRKTKCDELKELEKKQETVPAVDEYAEDSDTLSSDDSSSTSSSNDSSKSNSNAASSSDSDTSSSSDSDTSSSSDSSSSETPIVPKKKLKISENK